VLLEDRRRGTYEFVSSAPRSWRVQTRRLAAAVAAAVLLSAVLGGIWRAAARMPLPTAALTVLGPMLMLGAIAYAASVITASETASIAVAVLVWAVEQSPSVTRMFQGPLSNLYLFPLSAAGVHDVVGIKLGIIAAAFALLLLSAYLREGPTRLLDR